MEIFNLGDNLIRLRHEKKLTQDEIANFVGVTKAAVSKWENKQSMPDITILPSLATLFDISIDELIGYEPRVDSNQAKKYYKMYSDMFVERSFFEVLSEIKVAVKKYYSSYRFLLDICILLINHNNLLESEAEKNEVFTYIKSIIEHIKKECRDTNILEDVEAVDAITDLLMQNYQRIIDNVKEKANPTRMSNNTSSILVQALIMSQQFDDADLYSQTEILNSLFNMVGFSIYMLSFRMKDLDFCNRTMERVDKLIDLYDINTLNRNLTCQFYYNAAICKLSFGIIDDGIKFFIKFGENIVKLIKEIDKIQTFDDYFARVGEWLEDSELGSILPRDIKLVADDVKKMILHPCFEMIKDNEEIKRIIKEINNL